MALFGLVKDKVAPEKATLARTLKAEQGLSPAPLIPEDVDLSALWEDPNDTSSLATILSGVAAVASSIGMIAGFFGK